MNTSSSVSFVLKDTDVGFWLTTWFMQLFRRPNSTYMETVQRDITQSMRGILVDWLVEVRAFSMLVSTVVLSLSCSVE